MAAGSSASTADSCSWTEVCASNAQQASLNKQHLDFVIEFDPYLVSVGRQIGEGGQGCIYEAKLHLPHSFKPVSVAVKKFKPFVGVSQGHFPREIFSANSSRLCLPDGCFFEEDSLCMIMKRFSCDLRAAIDFHMKALRDKGFGTNGQPFMEAVGSHKIMLQLAIGLKYLHDCGVYHGDLKAANILVRAFGKNYGHVGHLAIADFERSEGVVGTAFWRAPEVLQSLRTRDPLSKEQWLLADVYSFGMVCYEVLTGLIPFGGHPLSDYDLILNGGRPELPDHVPKPTRDLLLRCWHADPHSRPSWTDIIEVLAQYDDASETGNVNSIISNGMSMEPLSFESLIHMSKQMVLDLTTLHESDSKNFGSQFMPYYWASEFVTTVEEYASKFEVDSFLESPGTCSAQESFERKKFWFMMIHQMLGVKFDYLKFIDLFYGGHLDMVGHTHETLFQRYRLLCMLDALLQKVFQESNRPREFTSEFEIRTSWIGKLLHFHALVKWVLWYEHADQEMGRQKAIGIYLLRISWIQAFLSSLCMMLNMYIYVLAMITCEPILLGLQYVLYKAKGSNNILYQSSGERICRFQRAWVNSTRYKVVSIILSFSFVTLVTMYGWRGILSWILIPCVIIISPFWRRSIILYR